MTQEYVPAPPCCVALTQEHRGHGVSTAAYYLGRVLIAQGLRVLLVDMTGRRACLNALFSQGAVKNLVYWAPPIGNLQMSRVWSAGRDTRLPGAPM
jgi:hypothetical protein